MTDLKLFCESVRKVSFFRLDKHVKLEPCVQIKDWILSDITSFLKKINRSPPFITGKVVGTRSKKLNHKPRIRL